MRDLKSFKQEFNSIKEMYEDDQELLLKDLRSLKSDILLVMVEIDNKRSTEYIGLKKLENDINQFVRDLKEKEDEVEYDPEAELDNMFPNRHDDDFDEDSMSYDSVFGGD